VTLALIDLGYGNVGSIRIAFERLGQAVENTSDPDTIMAAERVVLPGVGAAGFAMERIRTLGLDTVIPAIQRPLLGICLGMQLLFDHSEEEDTQCLGIIAGTGRRMAPGRDRPVPHMGWNRLEVSAADIGLASGDYVYFAHSFACPDGPHSLAIADHGGPVPAVVAVRNFVGAQFHPERSGEAGARFLKAFLAR
jgi:imidazole glycerol-phosphate synthase subunit HisH